ncbi:MAG: radical SAM protein [Desulfovibrionaceae bacterium]|nr:radical SAM protein [Desulfovibrionaceae bacterium]
MDEIDVRHPCFSAAAKNKYSRIHLPVAPLCNLQCRYCDRNYSCVNESRPGVTASLITPKEAVDVVGKILQSNLNVSVVGIAGPGDPLANPNQTFETFRLIRAAYPDLLLCLSTNGLALPNYADEILDLGITHLTVTVNAIDPVIASQIYAYVTTSAGRLCGIDAAKYLLECQEEGVRRLSTSLTIKVNTVVISGLNDSHIPAIAAQVSLWGAKMMNCIPLLPVAGTALAKFSPPNKADLHHWQHLAEQYLPQMRHCSRCRADAVGLLHDSSKICTWQNEALSCC